MMIERIVICNPEQLTSLLVSSFSEGNTFMKKFLDEFDSQFNTVKHDAEAYFIAKIEGNIVGMIGLHKDMQCLDDQMGKLKHLYVLPQFRKMGIASALIGQAIEAAKENFTVLTLCIDSTLPEHLYTKFGFIKSNLYSNSTHILYL